MIPKRRPVLWALVLWAFHLPAPLAAQTSLTALTTEQLYAEARAKAARVTERCNETSKTTYLEAMSYLFAYYQVASRDGSLKSDPAFDRNIRNQFFALLRTARKCLDLVDMNSRAQMRDDGTGPQIAAPPPVYSVPLPDPPPAGAMGGLVVAPPERFHLVPKMALLQPGGTLQFSLVGGGTGGAPVNWRTAGGIVSPGGVFTAGSGRGIFALLASRGGETDTAFIAVAGSETQADPRVPQLQDEIAQLKQQRDAYAAEVTRLRTAQPPNLSGQYQIEIKANGMRWHEDGGGDRLVSTRYQPNDDHTRFILELQPDGSYRIRVKANDRYLRAPGDGDQLLSTAAAEDDDFSRFFIEPAPDGFVRIRQKASGRYLGLRTDRVLTTSYESADDYTRFRLVP